MICSETSGKPAVGSIDPSGFTGIDFPELPAAKGGSEDRRICRRSCHLPLSEKNFSDFPDLLNGEVEVSQRC